MEYKHIAWCRDEETNADKVWGTICLSDEHYFGNNKYVTFWGRRGKKLQTKIWEGSNWDAKEMFLKKQNKGYRSVERDELNEVYPDFEKDLQKTAVWSMLKC